MEMGPEIILVRGDELEYLEVVEEILGVDSLPDLVPT